MRNGIVSLKEMRLAIGCTFVGAAIGAEAVQYVDAGILTSLIPILLVAISLYFLLMPKAKAPRVKQKYQRRCLPCVWGRGRFL